MKPGKKGPREAPPKPTRACPCWSGRTYDACCAPYHQGDREAPDPASLMRSRYAAFALGEAEYLVRTLAEGHPDQGLPREGLLRSLRGAKDRLRYPSLAILDERRRGNDAEVLFAAGIVEGGLDVSFVELSDFERDGGSWRYLSGILVPRGELGREPEGLTIDEFLRLASRP